MIVELTEKEVEVLKNVLIEAKEKYVTEMDYTRRNYVTGMNADGDVNSYPKKESKPSRTFSSYSLNNMLKKVSDNMPDDVDVLAGPKPTKTNKRLVYMLFSLRKLDKLLTVIFDTALDVKKVLYDDKLVYTNTKGFDTDLIGREEMDVIYDFISTPPFKTRM